MPVPGESLSPDSRRKMMEEERSQKKLMNQRVSAIREVVHNKSNDEIIMALHNFDMDVERTIQAFCDDSAQAALDTWTTGTGKTAKNKKKRNKKAGRATDSLSSASPLPPYSESATPTSPPGSVVNGDIGGVNAALFSSDGGRDLVNGLNGGGAPQPQRILNGGGAGARRNREAPRPQQQAGPSRPSNVPLMNGGAGHHTGYQHPAPERKREISANSAPLLDPYSKKKAGEKDLKVLARHDAVEERVQMRFNEEISKAADRIRRSFEELRKMLDSREDHLTEELARCKEEGTRLLAERMERGRQLHIRSERTAAMSEKEIEELRKEIKEFTSDTRHEEELGSTIRFRWDPDTLLALIKNFGEVVGVKPIATTHKHSSSHSSLVSSLGEDSGLGMNTSPVSPAADDEKKRMTEVESGGIVMKSETLTAEQLEDLNRRLQESLQLQGITADILQGVGGAASMPPRRPRPPPGARGRGGVGRGRGGARGGRGGGGRGGGPQQPNLSIFAEEA